MSPTVVLLRTVVAAGAGLSIWLFTVVLVRMSGTQRDKRLKVLLTYSFETRADATLEAEDVLAAQVAAQPFYQRTLRPLWQRLSRVALKYAPSRIIVTLQRQLDAAGNPRRLAPHEFLLAKMVAMSVGMVVGMATDGFMTGADGPLRALLYVLATAGAGFMLPDLWVYRRRKRHLEGIARVLPDVVDLLRVSMEGGLSYEGAVSYVVAKTESPLAYELNRYLIDRQIGRGQSESMRAMGNRTRQHDLMNLVEVVVQGEAMGTGINRALHAFSSDLRVRRRQRAEKKAHEAAMKMIFPMILLIFPAVFIIILGPTVPIFMQSFGLHA